MTRIVEKPKDEFGEFTIDNIQHIFPKWCQLDIPYIEEKRKPNSGLSKHKR